MAPITPGNLQAQTLEAIADIQEQLNRLEVLHRVAPLGYTTPHLIHTDPLTNFIFQRDAQDDNSDFIGVSNKAFWGAPGRGVQVEGLQLSRVSNNQVSLSPGRLLFGDDPRVKVIAVTGQGVPLLESIGTLKQREDLAGSVNFRLATKEDPQANQAAAILTLDSSSIELLNGNPQSPSDGCYSVLACLRSDGSLYFCFSPRTGDVGFTDFFGITQISTPIVTGATPIARLGYILYEAGHILDFEQIGDTFYLKEVAQESFDFTIASSAPVKAPPGCQVFFSGRPGVPSGSTFPSLLTIRANGADAMYAERLSAPEFPNPRQAFSALTNSTGGKTGRVLGRVSFTVIGAYASGSNSLVAVSGWRDLNLDSRPFSYV